MARGAAKAFSIERQLRAYLGLLVRTRALSKDIIDQLKSAIAGYQSLSKELGLCIGVFSFIVSFALSVRLFCVDYLVLKHDSTSPLIYLF